MMLGRERIVRLFKKSTVANSNKRVAIIGTRGYPSYYGGFETAVRKISPYLADSGWIVDVYGRPRSIRNDDPEMDPRINSIFTRGFETKSISTLSYGFTASIDALYRKPDVALVMNVANGFFLPLLRMRGIKTVVNVDGIEWDRAKWGGLAKMVFRFGAKLTARYADELVYDSHEIARRWELMFGRKGVYIPYGGDFPGNLPIEKGLKHRGYVLLVARFVEENSITEFIEAVPAIASKLPVVIVGSSGYGGELDSRVKALDQEHENVTWLGHLSDDRRLLSLWQHAGVYFHGHSVGGTNPTLVQAMATGCPIVARDTPYNREVLPESATFFQPEPHSIAKTIIELATDHIRQENESQSNIARAEELFTWSRVCRLYDSAITSTLKR